MLQKHVYNHTILYFQCWSKCLYYLVTLDEMLKEYTNKVHDLVSNFNTILFLIFCKLNEGLGGHYGVVLSYLWTRLEIKIQKYLKEKKNLLICKVDMFMYRNTRKITKEYNYNCYANAHRKLLGLFGSISVHLLIL